MTMRRDLEDDELVSSMLRRPVRAVTVPPFATIEARSRRSDDHWPGMLVAAGLVLALVVMFAVGERRSSTVAEPGAAATTAANVTNPGATVAGSAVAGQHLTRPEWGSLVRAGDVVRLATEPAAGTFVFTIGASWRYDGSTGVLSASTRSGASIAEHLAPTGGLIALEHLAPTPSGSLIATELAIRDGAVERVVYRAPIGFYWWQWSPDGRYVALWEIPDTFSGSIDLDGRPLVVIDASTGRRIDLGTTLLNGTVAWASPHTLAFIAGGGRLLWSNKTLRLWSPDTGIKDVTGAGIAAFAPVWSSDNQTLYFVTGPTGEYEPLSFFAGRGVGNRAIATYDVRGGTVRVLAHESGYVEEGVRPSLDSTHLLVLRRRAVFASDVGSLPDAPLEVWLTDPTGQRGVALVRISRVGFGYYGSYPGPSDWEWTR